MMAPRGSNNVHVAVRKQIMTHEHWQHSECMIDAPVSIPHTRTHLIKMFDAIIEGNTEAPKWTLAGNPRQGSY